MSSTLEYLLVLQETPIGHVIGKSPLSVGFATQVVHILGFVLLLSSVALSNLRLLGVVLPSVPLADIFWSARKLLWTGLGLVVLSGSLLFISFVKLYYFNPAFQLKILLLLLAVMLQITLFRSLGSSTQLPSPLIKAVAIFSLLLWFGIGLAGRAIGFV